MPIFYDKIYGRKLYICLYDTHTDDRTNTALASVPRQVTQFTHHVTHTQRRHKVRLAVPVIRHNSILLLLTDKPQTSARTDK